nr:LINE-type retrotransposon LIb DNA [Ipomoea batatas]
MLVTKKSKPVEAAKNSRQSRKDPNSSVVNRGNQFSVLADVNDHVEPTVSRNKTDKGKSKAAPRQTPKDKSSIPSTSAPPTRNSSLPSQDASPVHAQRTTHNVRNRGGRTGAPRGRYRGSGRDIPVSHDFSGSVSTIAGWINQPPHHDVFRFAATVADTHTPAANAPAKVNGTGVRINEREVAADEAETARISSPSLTVTSDTGIRCGCAIRNWPSLGGLTVMIPAPPACCTSTPFEMAEISPYDADSQNTIFPLTFEMAKISMSGSVHQQVQRGDELSVGLLGKFSGMDKKWERKSPVDTD